jgi:glycerate 2-kinase
MSAADPGRCVARHFAPVSDAIGRARGWNVVAAGKAACPMLASCLANAPSRPRLAMAVSPVRPALAPDGVECIAGGHPVPTGASVLAGRRALALAAATAVDDVLVVLLSGGASALMESPAEGIALADLRAATDRLLRAGADIGALNSVRKHLSGVKGGRLASAAAGRTVALVVSDVVGDDLPVIASGPTVGDPTTFADAIAVLDRFGGRGTYPDAVVAALEAGVRGERAETPKPGSAALARSTTIVAGGLDDAIEGARREAVARGYDVDVARAPVTGEARLAAAELADRIRARSAGQGVALCQLSGGETTVTVIGPGKGGRNQELALALVPDLAAFPFQVVVASVGTDGIDGPTDAAGAIADTDTLGRARAAGIDDPRAYLRDNNAYAFFQALGDLVITGPTGTNVGDIQVVMILQGVPT